MFSGIVEECATLVAMVRDQENVHFTFKCSFVNELKIDQSVSHNGVCLTVVSMTDDTYTVTAMKETLDRSNLGLLKVGDEVNVERSMMMNGRLDGHIVQGHVDQTATCVDIKDAEGSYYFTFRYAFDKEMAKRGYITVDKRLGNRKRCQPDRVQPYGRYLSGSHYPLYLRAYQFPRFQGG